MKNYIKPFIWLRNIICVPHLLITIPMYVVILFIIIRNEIKRIKKNNITLEEYGINKDEKQSILDQLLYFWPKLGVRFFMGSLLWFVIINRYMYG